MAGADIPPTKTNLRKVKADLSFAYEGFELLDQKREILVIEIIKYVRMIKETEKEFKMILDEFYNLYRTAAVDMGSPVMALEAPWEKKRYGLTMDTMRFMGMRLPVLGIESDEAGPPQSLLATGASYDMIKTAGERVVKVMVNYAMLTKTIYILSNELKKVQRRVNALEKIFIPRYEQTKKFISDRLEEMEREEIFIKKLIEKRHL